MDRPGVALPETPIGVALRDWTGEEKLLSVDPKDSCEAHLDVEDESDGAEPEESQSSLEKLEPCRHHLVEGWVSGGE